jgi:hypothetical protein
MCEASVGKGSGEAGSNDVRGHTVRSTDDIARWRPALNTAPADGCLAFFSRTQTEPLPLLTLR